MDLPSIGRKFTWVGAGNKRSRLDRFLVDESWVWKVSTLGQEGPNRTVSDHIPVVLSNEEIDWGPRTFKFISGWLSKKAGLEKIFNRVLYSL